MNEEETLCALRRHMAGPLHEAHRTIPGGIQFELGNVTYEARDEQVCLVANEMHADECRRRKLQKLLSGELH